MKGCCGLKERALQCCWPNDWTRMSPVLTHAITQSALIDGKFLFKGETQDDLSVCFLLFLHRSVQVVQV